MSIYIEHLERRPSGTQVAMRTQVIYEVLVNGETVWSRSEPVSKRIKYRELCAREQEAEARRWQEAIT